MITAGSGTIFWALMFGAVGMAYFAYGKAERHPIALFAGILLCVYPYFVGDNVLLTLLIGAGLIAAPFLIKV